MQKEVTIYSVEPSTEGEWVSAPMLDLAAKCTQVSVPASDGKWEIKAEAIPDDTLLIVFEFPTVLEPTAKRNIAVLLADLSRDIGVRCVLVDAGVKVRAVRAADAEAVTA